MIWSAITSCIGSVASTFPSALSSIGSALASFAKGPGPDIGTIVAIFIIIANLLLKFANDFLQAVGLIRPDEDIKDLGERALQAAEAGITMDDFPDFDSYLQRLRDFPLDPEKARQHSDDLKLTAGLGIASAGLEKKFNAEPGSLGALWLLPIVNPGYFTPERMQVLLIAGRLGHSVCSYLENQLSAFEEKRFEDRLSIDIDGKPMSDAEKEKLYAALEQAKQAWADLRSGIADVSADHVQRPEQNQG